MIRRLFNSVGQRIQRHDNKPDTSFALDFEPLEERLLLTFIGFFDGVTLDINQTADDGDVLIENTTGVWRATDNSSTFTFVNATNIEVNLLSGTVNQLDLAVDLVHNGDITLNLNDGPRQVFFLGTLNEIGGNLNINGGTNSQEINLAEDPAAALLVHGNVNIDLGEGFDTVLDNGQLITIEKNATFIGVNDLQMAVVVGLPGPPITGGDVTIDTSGEDMETFITLSGTLYDDFNFTGGVDIDHVDLSTTVFGDTTINLGTGEPFFGDAQNIDLLGLHQGNVILSAGDSILGNEINLLGTFTGNIVSYTGGDLVDTIDYSFIGLQADVFVDMGAGDDVFILNQPVNLLEIDFGNDPGDMFINNVGPIDFEYDITNFHFFDFFYTALDDSLLVNQIADTGDLVIDNQGGIGGTDWQFLAGGGISSTGRAENLIVNMLSNTGNKVDFNLVNPVIASISLNLGDGDRLVQFTGLANNPLRDINITAGAGNQHVDLSVNQPLGVATLSIDLGTGFDTVNDNANSLIINEDFILIGVNNFVNDGILSVLRDAFIDTSMENEDTLFDSNGSMFVGRFFTYLGGDGADDLQLNGVGGTVINREAVIDLGNSTGGLDQFVLLDSADTSFGRSLSIHSTNALGTDFLTSDAGTEFMGNLTIDLGNGNNQVIIVGSFTGTTFNYTGGSGVDDVTYGLTGNPVVLSVSLGAGDDTFNLLPGTSIANPLFIDFGTGTNTFVNGFGAFTFDATLLGLNGFNHSYAFATGTLVSTQVADVGDIIVDNNGPSQAIQFTGGGMSTLTPVTNLTIDLMNGSTNDLEIDLGNALAGNLIVDLDNGIRFLDLTGASNSVGGNLTITGGSAAQAVDLAVNTALTVGGNTSLSLGSGDDSATVGALGANITGGLSMIGVNFFENNGTTTVGSNVSVDSSFETESSSFDNNGMMTITGNFIYSGGSGDDNVGLDGVGGTSIGGAAIINLGGNTLGGVQTVSFNGSSSVGGDLTVSSTSSANADSFMSDFAAGFGGGINIDFGAGTNTANIVGVLGGTNVTYKGGSGVDTVTFGTTGNPAIANIDLGLGNDSLTLLAGTSISPTSFTANFGGGSDTFNNQYGNFDFNANLLNLNGFTHVYNLASDSLTSTQVGTSGPSVTIDNNGVNNAIRFLDGGTSELTDVTDLTVNMLDSSGTTLNIKLDSALTGDLAVDLGNGSRALNLNGTSNSVGGDLSIMGGIDAQNVELAVASALSVGGNALVDLGAGSDLVDEDGRNISITGNLDFAGVNSFNNNGIMTVGGNLTVDNSSDSDASLFANAAGLDVTGDFAYTGGSGQDEVKLNGAGGTTIGGTADVHVGNNTSGGTQAVEINSALSSVGGALNVTSTDSANTDSFVSHVGAMLGGDIKVNLGDGTNNATILGVFGGTNVKYTGGSGVDNVEFGTTGSPADVNINLGGGEDTFTLEAGASISPTTLRVDFGSGNDAFVNNFGAFTFNANLLNLQGYTRIYDHASSSLTMTQLANNGNLTIDNNGAGGAIRTLNGFISEMTPADNIRLNMLANSTSNVMIDYDLAQAGDTILDLKNGNRNVRFVGDSNEIGGFLRIDAGTNGVQNIHLAVNADLTVGEAIVINLRGGNDSVDDNTHNINVGSNFILRAVNVFRIDQTVDVGGNFTMNTTFDNETSVLDNNGTFNIGANMNYFGGTKGDNVFMNSALILGNVNVELGTGTSSQTADFSGADVARLRIAAGTSSGGNFVVTDAFTKASADVIMRFDGTSSVNNVKLLGTYTGTYGTFRGSAGVDNVTFGAIASNMNFVAKMSSGNDIFNLKTGTMLFKGLLDFGNGNDTFNDEIGAPYPFPLTIKNLP